MFWVYSASTKVYIALTEKSLRGWRFWYKITMCKSTDTVWIILSSVLSLMAYPSPKGKFRCDKSIFCTIAWYFASCFTPFRRTGAVIVFAGRTPQRNIVLFFFSFLFPVPWNILSLSYWSYYKWKSFSAATWNPIFKQFIIQKQRFILSPCRSWCWVKKFRHMLSSKTEFLWTFKQS